MGFKIITLKVLFVYLYNAFLAPIPKLYAETSLSNDKPPEWLFFFLFFALWLPEIAIFAFRDFRDWLKEGFEDGDGVLKKSDVKDLLPFYASFLFAKTVVLMSWTMIFYDVVIPFYFYITLVIASFGVGSLPLLKSIYGHKK